MTLGESILQIKQIAGGLQKTEGCQTAKGDFRTKKQARSKTA